MKWSVEGDALAFLTELRNDRKTDYGSQEGGPKANGTAQELELKLGECMWWLIVLADRMEINIGDAMEAFLTKTERALSRTFSFRTPV